MPTREIIYYTCNTHDLAIEIPCRVQLRRASQDIPIISVSRGIDIDYGDKRIVIQGKFGPRMMFKQILAGIQASTADIVYTCDSDVLYHPSHFTFLPDMKDVFYYNINVWICRYPDGHCAWVDDREAGSGVCAYREIALDFYTRRVVQLEKEKFDHFYEPNPRAIWKSEFPNIDVRHNHNLTHARWSPREFIDRRNAKGWKEAGELPGWGQIEGRFAEFLKGLENAE